jgi:acetyl esterase/lipase
MTVTKDTKLLKIESLKEKIKYLMYPEFLSLSSAGVSIAELCRMFPGWNETAIVKGLQFLSDTADRQEVLFDVYDKDENELDQEKQDVKVWYFPALETKRETARNKPFIILLAGGGYEQVCTLVEALPSAAHFCRMGYNVFCLNYRVGDKPLFPKPLDDLSAAYRMICSKKEDFQIETEEYIVGGYSAGGHLCACWGTEKMGYHSYGLKKPMALFLVYPLLSKKLLYREGLENMLQCVFRTPEEAREEDVIDHITENYPPTFLVHCAEDLIVPVANSIKMKETLDAYRIPAEMEIGINGKHGFGDGADTDVAGWPERAISFVEKLF